LPLAVGDVEWNAYLERRKARRRTALPAPEFLSVVGATESDRARIERVLQWIATRRSGGN
jgi:hypothetical protein